MAAAGDVIQLVAEIAVGAVDSKVQRERRQAEDEFGPLDNGTPAAHERATLQVTGAFFASSALSALRWIITAMAVSRVGAGSRW
jgi:hypothetical protein